MSDPIPTVPLSQDDEHAWDEYEGCLDFPEDRVAPAFCDHYVIHEPHLYRAINGSTYACPGWDAEDEAEAERQANEPPCEHGLSRALCAGPGHYPADL